MTRVQPSCLIVSSDYLDLDVALNVRAFYSCIGYRILSKSDRHEAVDLLVVLRGDNGTDQREFRGEVHIYDYVKEYTVDWAARYPLAARIQLVSLSPHGAGGSAESAAAAGEGLRLHWIQAYLPVIPALWQRPCLPKDERPLHLSNYKRMAGDPFQHQLLEQIQAGMVRVFGANWQLVGVSTHPLSYWQANRLLARHGRCFGLMWPYQRGRTLSGRMWQAPLQGCFVLSEAGTDLLGMPGVVQLHSFAAATLPPAPDGAACLRLRQEAAAYWEAHTRSLAASLGFDPQLHLEGAPLRRQRWALRWNHLEFLRRRWLQHGQGWLQPPLTWARRCLARGARRLGCHPRPRS